MNDRYEDFGGTRQSRDVILSTNEFCFLQSKTNGSIKSHVGPTTVTISQQEVLVVFDPASKKFREVTDLEKAKQLFTSAPEGWYVILKNPMPDNQHPKAAQANETPGDPLIGTKINIPGPTSFALYPGQMAKTVRGHKLRSNQYLLARVYDADAAKAGMENATVVDAEGKEVDQKSNEYFVGQLLVIKGTEVSFYIPPTGIEVIAQENGDYVRDAVTLERLEYAILKDEDGEKRYVHGPAVVFPKPTETFVEANPKKHTVKFRAFELSPISGIYVKVIADYKDEQGKEHKAGEELFITGKDQMIYYPRPEHAIIDYNGKYMHHAIAIPKGEGRYIMDRLKGTIKTVKGPQMYLADPRTEVVVLRKLSDKECELFYPDNEEVLNFNRGISEREVEKWAKAGKMEQEALNTFYSTADVTKNLAAFEMNANISRGTSYTKPRSITLDTKYDGVVGINIWTGYAVNVVSKDGSREVVVGPQTRLLDYDETLEALHLSTGKPKTTDNILSTGYLRVENNKISDVIKVQTSDFVDVEIKVSYCVDFLEEYKDKWFSVDNYVKFLCDRQRSLLKREVKKYTIQEFYNNSTDICRNILLNISDETKDNGLPFGRFFEDNGMLVKDVEILSVHIEASVARMLEEHQNEIIAKTLELSDAEAKINVVTKLAEVRKKELDLQNQNDMYELELANERKNKRIQYEEQQNALKRATIAAEKQAQKDLQPILDEIAKAQIAREKEENSIQIEKEKAELQLDKARKASYAAMVEKIMNSISEDLVAALNAKANSEMLETVTGAMSPYAVAEDTSVADVTNKLLRGTSLEGIIDKMK